MNPKIIDPIIQRAFEEDLPWGDITTENVVDADHTTTATMILKDTGVIAGLPVARRVFKYLDHTIQWTPLAEEGTQAVSGTVLAELMGNTRHILMAERIALNFIQRMSGIATLTHQYVSLARQVSDTVQIADTRKTTPGIRYMEKYAVLKGGGVNHRYCLSDAVMLKDNHLAFIKQKRDSLLSVIQRLRVQIPHTATIELEVDRIDQIEEAIEAGVDTILLDNMSPDELKQAVNLINGRVKTEASGGVNLNTITDIAASGVDVISVGALTHSAPSLDIGLDFPA